MDMPMRWTRLLVPACLAAALLTPATLRAQDAAARAGIERFRDSLAAVTDTAALLRLERTMIDAARADRDNTLLHLRLGFLALRLGELGGDSHFDDAASEFQWAIDLEPGWPYPWYGMGLAEYAIGDSRVSVVAGLQSMLGKDALSRSAVAFARSAEVEPAFAQGLVELANTALAQRVNIKLDVALDALRRAGTTVAASNPDVLLARGRVEREVGDADSALAAFRRHVNLAPNRAMGLYEVARTRLMMGDVAGQLAYYEGASSNDSAVVATYRADLALIAPDSVLDAYDAARGRDRVAMLRDFWTTRDRQDLRGEGSRLAEHFRRFFYARRNFALAGTNRHYDIVERYRSGSKDFDDRGVIYLRHGAPTARAAHNAPDIEPNESWRYARPDGDLLFHFVAREDVQDYKLVESLFDVLGFSNAVLLGAADNSFGSDASALMTSREGLSPVYGRLQSVGRISGERFRADERRMGRQSIEIGTTSDSYTLTFGRELDGVTNVLAVGRDASGTLVQVTYAIEGEDLVPVPVSRGVLYTIRVRFMAMDSAGAVVATLDTTRGFVAAEPVPPREHLLGRIALHVPPGTHRYRLSIEQGTDAGLVTPLGEVRVGPAAPATPALSDIALGGGVSSLGWAREGADTVYFNPLRRFRRADEMLVYYDVTGIAAGADYSTELEVRKEGGGGFLRRLFGGGGAAISLTFDEEKRPEPGIERAVSLAKLGPGRYTVTVKVTDTAGRSDERSADFEVVGR